MEKLRVLTFRATLATERDLKRLAEKWDRPVGYVVRELVIRGLSAEEKKEGRK